MDLQTTPIRSMEPAIVERLRLAFPAKDFAIERVPSVLTIKEFTRITRSMPFIGLAWVGMTVDRDAGRQLHASMTWRLTLIVKASSALETRFKGDTRSIGLDAMIDVASALLQGVTFDNIGLCTVTGAQSVYAEGIGDDGIVIANVDFAIRYQFSAAELKLATPDDLRKLGVAWLVEPSTDPAGAPDAGQEITIPQEEDHA